MNIEDQAGIHGDLLRLLKKIDNLTERVSYLEGLHISANGGKKNGIYKNMLL